MLIIVLLLIALGESLIEYDIVRDAFLLNRYAVSVDHSK